MRIVSLIFLVLIVVLTIMFASLNATSTQVNYFVGEKELPLILVMFLSLILGVLLSWLVMVWKVIKLKTKIHSLNSKLSKAENNLSKMKDLDLKEG